MVDDRESAIRMMPFKLPAHTKTAEIKAFSSLEGDRYRDSNIHRVLLASPLRK
jgi:hypothetical protein